tara:strand:- start:6129 stop:7643 length:1515 start_codon:yes stop_codon:yes gene_type:complete
MCALASEDTQSALAALSALTLETEGKRSSPGDDDDKETSSVDGRMLKEIGNGWALFYRKRGSDLWRLEFRHLRPGMDPTNFNGQAQLRKPYMEHDEDEFLQLLRYVKNELMFVRHQYTQNGKYWWIETTHNSIPPQWVKAIQIRKEAVEALFMKDVENHNLSDIVVEGANIRTLSGYMHYRPEFHHLLTSDGYNFEHRPDGLYDHYITMASIEELPDVLQKAIATRKMRNELAREEADKQARNDAERRRLQDLAEERNRRQLDEYFETVQSRRRERAQKILIFNKVLGMDSTEEDDEDQLSRVINDNLLDFQDYVQQKHADSVASIADGKKLWATRTQSNLKPNAWPMTKIVQEMLTCVKKAADKINGEYTYTERVQCTVQLQLPSPLERVDIRVTGFAKYVDIRWTATFLEFKEKGSINNLKKLYSTLNDIWDNSMSVEELNAAYSWYRRFPDLPDDDNYSEIEAVPQQTPSKKPNKETDQERMLREELYTSDGWRIRKRAQK